MVKTTDKVLSAADTAKPYVDAALHDEDLRANMRAAYAAAREIYDDLAGRRGVTGLAQKVATDKEIQDNLRVAIEELRGAAGRLQHPGADDHKSRNTALLVTGIALGLLFNPVTGPSLRRQIGRAVKGGQGTDEFGFSPPSGNGTT